MRRVKRVLVCLTFFLYGMVKAQIVGSERKYLALTAWQQGSVAALNQYADAAAGAGFTTLRLVVDWARIEPSPGRYDFSYLDQTLAYAIDQKGLSVILTLWCKRGPDGMVTEASAMRTEDGATGRFHFSFHDTATVSKALEACRRVAERYRALYGKSQILAYLPVFNAYAETEYYGSSYYDYSPLAKTAFRTWLGKKYSSLAALNADWKTAYPSYQEINPSSGWSGEAKVSWYQFRSATLGRVIDRAADILHGVDPGLAMAAQFGSVWDGLVVRRGTICFGELTRKCDLVVVDDAPDYNHPFSMDYVRGTMKGRCFGNEVDGPDKGDDGTYNRQAKESFEHGARVLFVANWNPGSVSQRQSLFRRIRSDFIDKAIPGQVPAPTLTISARSVLAGGGAMAYQARYNTLSGNGSRWVDISLVDDLSFPATSTRLAGNPEEVRRGHSGRGIRADLLSIRLPEEGIPAWYSDALGRIGIFP